MISQAGANGRGHRPDEFFVLFVGLEKASAICNVFKRVDEWAGWIDYLYRFGRLFV